MEEPGGVQSTGSPRVRHDWTSSLRSQSSKDQSVGREPGSFYATLLHYIRDQLQLEWLGRNIPKYWTHTFGFKSEQVLAMLEKYEQLAYDN